MLGVGLGVGLDGGRGLGVVGLFGPLGVFAMAIPPRLLFIWPLCQYIVNGNAVAAIAT